MRWGIADVEEWLAGLDPRVLDWWVAFDQVEPITGEWAHTATVAAVTEQTAAIVAASRGVEFPNRKPQDFIPKRIPAKPERKRKRRMTADEIETTMRRVLGV